MAENNEEEVAAISVPATRANRFFLHRIDGQGTARIAFGEQLNGSMFYRQAVVMSDADMVLLRDLLTRFYPPPEAAN